ncbi:PAS domain-containing protein [Methanoculleus sp. Wushi-C6]|uniref:histidine kinase n=1 Tax=Methanoculleus caldifontis TaxID=2651577 RepID=A0ABU3X475_9EURY|nr:ATP-binding protein [Methanoculleus sp. Wushi-C6]MDV2482829.1 PAS domain-containing protein [Methanoculleus sp. Wushi-C6]
MSTADSLFTQPKQTFQILDEPGVGILVLDRDRKVAWTNAHTMEILSAREEEILGRDARRVLEEHLIPRVREDEDARRLLAAMSAGEEVPGLDLSVPESRGEERQVVYSSRKMHHEPFTGMWVLRLRAGTGRHAGGAAQAETERVRGLRTLHRISRLIDAGALPGDDLFREIARILPSGFRRPQRIGVRITHGDAVYAHRYRETPCRLAARIRVERKRAGSLEVVYLAGDTAFSGDEEYLIEATADMLGRALGRQNEEERYRSFVRDFQGIAYRKTVGSEPLFLHGAVETITGYTGDEFLAGTVCWDAIVHPDDRSRLQESADRLQTVAGFSTERVYRILHRDGTLRWVREFVQNVCSDDGTPVLIQGTVHDVTEQRSAGERLVSSNRQLLVLNQIMGVSASSLSLDELLEASLAKTLDLLDFDVGLTYLLNPERTAAQTRYNHEVPEEFLARNRTIKVHHWPWNFVLVAGQPRYLDLQSEPGTAGEEILSSLGVASLACIPILAESVVVGALFLGSRGRDEIGDDERHLLEAIGREIGSGVLRSMLHKRLEAAHRETNLYLDIMTHDIKNAENVASLYCDLLLDTLEGEGAEYAKKLRGCVRKSAGILQNVSTIRRIHQTSPELAPVHLSGVIRAELERIPEAAVSFEGTAAEVRADDLLVEVFANLIGNAVTHGGPDVRVAVRVEDYPEEEHTVVVSVEDTGPGIPDGMKEAIFDRSRGCGEGLGLYIVGMLVSRYGGRIWVEDRVPGFPEEGASFRFLLREVVHQGTDDEEME